MAPYRPLVYRLATVGVAENPEDAFSMRNRDALGEEVQKISVRKQLYSSRPLCVCYRT